ncbi:MAG: helix-turn-helix domain-containing protein [Polaromonas sp.]
MSETTPPERLLVTQEVADLLRKKKRTVEGWRNPKRAGGLPFIIVNGQPRYRPSDVDAFVMHNRRAGERM